MLSISDQIEARSFFMSSAPCLFLDRFPVHKSVQWRLYLFHKASTIKSLVNVTLLTPLAEATLFLGGGGGGGCCS